MQSFLVVDMWRKRGVAFVLDGKKKVKLTMLFALSWIFVEHVEPCFLAQPDFYNFTVVFAANSS